MVTDWLHNPRALMLMPPIAAAVCALLLAATRRRMPTEEPRPRLVRALIVVAFWIMSLAVQFAVLGRWSLMLLMPPMGLGAAVWLSLAAKVLGTALFFGWLIPWGIEGRSMREIGWKRHHAIRYFFIAAIITFVVASVSPMRGLPQDLKQTLGVQDVHAGAIIGMPIPLMWVSLMGFVYSGWAEENFYRGHLLPAFREVGLSGRGANMAQAGIFMLMHVPGLFASLSAERAALGPSGMLTAIVFPIVGWWLWGLLFGWLRMRFDSIVPGFAVHGTWNAVYLARTWIGAFVVMQQLS
jgi:membrane protease YdiL (CAAX protease family)